jgi:hypothetical protein
MNTALLDKFESISLETLDATAPLTKRFDTKFVLRLADAENFLSNATSAYAILAIGQDRIFGYQNNYFDTPELQCYFQHHNGKSNRYKIRRRLYKNTNASFIELKQKLNIDQTIKYKSSNENSTKWQSLLMKLNIHNFRDWKESIQINYNRITLLHKTTLEKVTLDFNYSCNDLLRNTSFNHIVMAEVKTTSRKQSVFFETMQKAHIKPGSLSKYCLGLIALNNELKHNNFKQAFKQILKVNNNG